MEPKTESRVVGWRFSYTHHVLADGTWSDRSEYVIAGGGATIGLIKAAEADLAKRLKDWPYAAFRSEPLRADVTEGVASLSVKIDDIS